MMELLLLTTVILWLGYLNWQLYSEVSELRDTNETQNDLIGLMAKELNEKGSPNVKLIPAETYNIQYENKE